MDKLFALVMLDETHDCQFSWIFFHFDLGEYRGWRQTGDRAINPYAWYCTTL